MGDTDSDSLALAMIALNEPRLPDEAALSAWLAARHVDLPPLTAVRRDGVVITADWSSLLVALSLMPVPIPLGRVDERCSSWPPEALRRLKDHRAHLIVSVAGDALGTIERNLALTWLVAAAASTTDSSAVYWGSGDVLAPPDDVADETASMSRDQLPLDLWIDFRMEREDDGSISLSTKGMRALGHTDLEVVRSRLDPATIRNRAWNAAHYLLDHGPVLKDGDTFGISNEERFRIEHVSSSEGDRVLRLVM